MQDYDRLLHEDTVVALAKAVYRAQHGENSIPEHAEICTRLARRVAALKQLTVQELRDTAGKKLTVRDLAINRPQQGLGLGVRGSKQELVMRIAREQVALSIRGAYRNSLPEARCAVLCLQWSQMSVRLLRMRCVARHSDALAKGSCER